MRLKPGPPEMEEAFPYKCLLRCNQINYTYKLGVTSKLKLAATRCVMVMNLGLKLLEVCLFEVSESSRV